MVRELTSLSLNINNDTLILSSVSEADPVTGGPAYKLSPSLPLGSHIWTMGELVITICLYLLVHTFCLAVGLGVVGRGWGELDSQEGCKVAGEVGYEGRSVVTDHFLWKSVMVPDVFQEQLGDSGGIQGGDCGYGVNPFRWRSTTTRAALYPLESGSSLIMSMEITCQHQSGTLLGISFPTFCVRKVFVWLHASHPATNLVTYLDSPGHQ